MVAFDARQPRTWPDGSENATKLLYSMLFFRTDIFVLIDAKIIVLWYKLVHSGTDWSVFVYGQCPRQKSVNCLLVYIILNTNYGVFEHLSAASQEPLPQPQSQF